MSIPRRRSVQNCSQLGYFAEEPGVKASSQGFTLADLVRGRGLFAPRGHCGRETEVNVDAWSSSHPMHPNRNANRYH
jgi:hypothetical protein